MSQHEIRERIARPAALVVLYSAVLILPLWAAFLGYITFEIAGDALSYILP